MGYPEESRPFPIFNLTTRGRMKRRHVLQAVGFAVLPFFLGAVTAAENGATGHPKTKSTDVRYRGAPVTIKPEEAKETLTPKAPPLTAAEFTRAKQIFFERCAGCHGVLRKCATDQALPR